MSADFRACQDGRSRPSGSWWANPGTHRGFGESPNRWLVFVDEVSGYHAALSQRFLAHICWASAIMPLAFAIAFMMFVWIAFWQVAVQP